MKVKLWKKACFTLFVLAVAGILGKIPTYGADSSVLSAFIGNVGLLSFADSLSGGALSNMSLAGFAVSSYISASIALQLLSIAFPALEGLWRSGQAGRDRLEKATLSLAIALTAASGYALAASGMVSGGMFYTLLAIAGWIFGTAMVVKLANMVQEKGIGNGITLILAMNILARMPGDLLLFYETHMKGAGVQTALLYGGCLAAGLLAVFLVAAYLQDGAIRIPFVQTKKIAADGMLPCGEIPIKAGVSSVLPVIYASTLLSIPAIVCSITKTADSAAGKFLLSATDSRNWYMPSAWHHIAGLFVYLILIFAFAIFASRISFCPQEVAESMRASGDAIDGINPGAETVEYLDKRRKVMALANALLLIILVSLPDAVCAWAGISSFGFLGTSLVILTGAFSEMSMKIKAERMLLKRNTLFGKEAL